MTAGKPEPGASRLAARAGKREELPDAPHDSRAPPARPGVAPKAFSVASFSACRLTSASPRPRRFPDGAQDGVEGRFPMR